MKIYKYVILLSAVVVTSFLFMISCCGALDLSNEIYHRDFYKIVIYKNNHLEKEFTLRKNEIPEKILKSWQTSMKEIGRKDYKSYSPNIMIESSMMRVNFGKKTVISFKKDSKEESVWLQYSREPTKEDNEMANWLKMNPRANQ